MNISPNDVIKNNEIIIGIDLGTTNSEVAIIHQGKSKVLSVNGSKMVPSVISLKNDGEILVGIPAVNNELAAPKDTIRKIKRKMGQEDIFTVGDHVFTPPMLSSLILKRLKLAAEEFLQHSISKAVITVPAFFNEQQREATKEAAALAGLEAVRLLNEPTAAALAYSLGKKESECCLIYDLGGGTFDVSIVYISPEVMEVKSSHGDVELGGTDFDRLIADKARQEFLSRHEIDLAKNPLAWARLMRAAETAKCKLSTEVSVEILEEFIAEDNGTPLHLQYKINRIEFETLIRPFIERTLVSVNKAIEMAEISTKQIDRVILVGGATLTPLVSELLNERLGIVPQAWLDPSLVVAMGASMEAANLAGQPIGPMMIDVTPHSLGTACCDNDGYLFNKILIYRNTPLPCTASRIFYKIHNQQSNIEIQAYQGESSELRHNQFLGKFLLEDVPESSGLEVCIKYHLDRSGLLHITATDVASGKKISQTLKRVANTRTKHANLADLSTVKLNVVDMSDLNTHLTQEDNEFWQAIARTEEDNKVEQEAVVLSTEESELIARSKKLLENDLLDATDKNELIREVELAENGDKEALARLTSLVYFLE